MTRINYEKLHDLTDSQKASILFWLIGVCQTQLTDEYKTILNKYITDYNKPTKKEKDNEHIQRP